MSDTMFPIKSVTGADLAFGGPIRDLMPAYRDLPREYPDRGKWLDLVDDWFFSGLKSFDSKPRAGVDKGKAMAHVRAIICSFEPSHEHKREGCAWLLSQWFESPKWTVAKRKNGR
jgi:hypothetical protein